MKHLNWGGGVGGGQEAAADELTDRGKQQLRRTEVWHSSPRCLLLLTAGAEQHRAERKEKRKAYLLHRAFSLSTALRHRLSFLKRKSRPPHQKHPCWFFFFTAGKKPPSLTERVSGCSNLQNVPQIRSGPSVRVVLPAASVLGAPVTSALLPQQLLQLLCALFSLSLPFFPLRAAVLLPRVDSRLRVHVHRRMGAL